MKYFPALLFAAILPVQFAQCQKPRLAPAVPNEANMEGPWIFQVKGAVLDFDKGITIGDAFDNYKFFGAAASWSATRSANKRRIIEVSGTIDLKKLKVDDIAEVADWLDISKLKPADIENGAYAQSGPPFKATPAENEERLRKIVQKFNGLQLIFQFQLNVDNSVEVKSYAAHLITTDNKIVELADKTGQPPLHEIYNGLLPVTQIIETILASSQSAPPEK